MTKYFVDYMRSLLLLKNIVATIAYLQFILIAIVMILYHIASTTKIILGIAIMLITYTSINIYEDPAIAIGLGFVGLFIVIWGISFYIFLFFQRIFRHSNNERIMKDSYKLSLLFGIYIVINILLLLLGLWNKLRGSILLIGFIGLQMLLFKQTPDYDGSQK